MPRIRTIKPEFYRHHDLFLAEKTSKLPIRVAFSGLWLCADKEGRFKWKPTELKLDILPYDDVDFNKVLDCLIKHHFIIKYTVEGRNYGLIPTFKEHQRITGTEKNYESKLPEYVPENGNTLEIQDDSVSIPAKEDVNSETIDNQMAFQDASTETLRQVGKEYKKGIKEIERSIGTVIPENFSLLNIYNKKFNDIQKCFPELSENGFSRWKHFIDFIYQKSFHEIFRFKCINPVDFEKLDFPENEWEETIRMLLSTGIEEKHNLFFRIPQFQKYAKKGVGKNNNHLSDYESKVLAEREKYRGKK